MCTAGDAEDYKEKIRQSCLRTIEKAEKLKQHLAGVDGNVDATGSDE